MHPKCFALYWHGLYLALLSYGKRKTELSTDKPLFIQFENGTASTLFNNIFFTNRLITALLKASVRLP
jgi:hypothetical protein